MGSDQVNSITDSTEAQDVAHLVRQVYYHIAGRANLGESFTVFQLNASTDSDKKTLMTRPDLAYNIIWLKYNAFTEDDTDDPLFKDVTYLPVNDFFTRIYNLRTTDDNTGTFEHVVGTDTVTFIYRNDKAPSLFTSFDDNTIIFDSYDSEVDSTLQKVKTLVYGGKSAAFTMTDAFTPALDDQQFSLLLNESKALAWAEIKQATHERAERMAKREWVNLQRSKTAFGTQMSYYDTLPSYGRK